MMYYDRTLSDDLLAACAPGGALAWLVPWTIAQPDTRLDLRREDNDRRHGCVQVYAGRTSPIELLGRTRGKVRVWAREEKYRKVSPDLFKTYGPEELDQLRGPIQVHIEACRRRMPSDFTGGEAPVQNGMMRRYGPAWRPDDPLLAIDSEIAFGFRADARYPDGTAHKKEYKRLASKDPGLPRGISPLRQLDALGLLADGNLAVIEVKAAGGDMLEAARQTAAHVYNLSQLRAQADLPGTLSTAILQKQQIGWLPEGRHTIASKPSFIPIIAAPDTSPDWAARWRRAVQPLRAKSRYLRRLQLWRLSDDGEILEVEEA